MKNKSQKLDKVAKSILNLPAVEHKRPKFPTKKDMNRKFRMRVVSGRVVMEEVK